ncbi:MAG: hypothetical protein AAGG75_01415 [Bacteroidota bacterium]
MLIPPNFPTPLSPEGLGTRADMKVLVHDKWLINTEVRYDLKKRYGQWHLTMIYIAVNNPLQFICRNIDTYPSEKKAQLYAQIFLRGIRKDARGTLKTNQDAFNFCDN